MSSCSPKTHWDWRILWTELNWIESKKGKYVLKCLRGSRQTKQILAISCHWCCSQVLVRSVQGSVSPSAGWWAGCTPRNMCLRSNGWDSQNGKREYKYYNIMYIDSLSSPFSESLQPFWSLQPGTILKRTSLIFTIWKSKFSQSVYSYCTGWDACGSRLPIGSGFIVKSPLHLFKWVVNNVLKGELDGLALCFV